jgi:hypothetical protein
MVQQKTTFRWDLVIVVVDVQELVNLLVQENVQVVVESNNTILFTENGADKFAVSPIINY